MSILQNTLRIGNFTSSEAFKLTKKDKSGKGLGEPAIRYIMQTNDERMLGECIDEEADAKPLQWGKLIEPMVHDKLGLEYTFCSDITKAHPTIPYWVGSKDGTREIAERTIIDYKAPTTKTSFVGLVRPLYQGFTGYDAMIAIRDGYTYNGFKYPKHKDGEKYFWQQVSNAIIDDVEWGELIVFMPYQRELIEVQNLIGDDRRYNWITNNPDAVPCLKDDSMFKNLNIIRFKIPQSDKDFLTECVTAAGAYLIK